MSAKLLPERTLLSAGVWLLLPALTLLGFRSSRWQDFFRARPFNDSYDAMFIAAAAGIGLTSFWIWLSCRERRQDGKQRVRPAYCCRQNAFHLFELASCASLGFLNFMVGVPGSALVWSAAFVCLLAGTAMVARSQNKVVVETPSRRTTLNWTMSAFLIAAATLFILFPVLQPWSGPPELFVRWHPFSPAAELLWRGIFLSFAFGMLLAAVDPGGRHRPFVVLLVLSGYLHAAEMAVDNLVSARVGGMNRNPEHLYGDVLGWFAIASLALLFLILDRRNESGTRAPSIR